MNAQEKEAERILTENGCQLVEDCLQQLRTTGTGLAPDAEYFLRRYGPLLYKAGAAHVFLNYDCYPKVK